MKTKKKKKEKKWMDVDESEAITIDFPRKGEEVFTVWFAIWLNPLATICRNLPSATVLRQRTMVR